MSEHVCECGWKPKAGAKYPKQSLATHQLLHCKLGKKESSGDKKKVCECADGGDWRFLDRSKLQEAAAISKGYKRVCNVCREVL